MPRKLNFEVSSNILTRRGWKEFTNIREARAGLPSTVGTPDLAEYTKTKFSNGEREAEFLATDEDPNDLAIGYLSDLTSHYSSLAHSAPTQDTGILLFLEHEHGEYSPTSGSLHLLSIPHHLPPKNLLLQTFPGLFTHFIPHIDLSQSSCQNSTSSPPHSLFLHPVLISSVALTLPRII